MPKTTWKQTVSKLWCLSVQWWRVVRHLRFTSALYMNKASLDLSWIYMRPDTRFVSCKCVYNTYCACGGWVLFYLHWLYWIEKDSKMQSIFQMIKSKLLVSIHRQLAVSRSEICYLTLHCLHWCSYKQDLNVRKCECEPSKKL